jgi:hypothetical protein
VLEALCQKFILCVFLNVRWNEIKSTPKIIQNVCEKRTFSCPKCTTVVCFHLNILQLWCIIVYYCVFTIRILRKRTFKKSNNYWMLYKSLFESLISIYGQLSILQFFYLKECIKWCNWFLKICTRNPCFPLCNYMFIRSIKWKNKSYENFKILKFSNKRLWRNPELLVRLKEGLSWSNSENVGSSECAP